MTEKPRQAAQLFPKNYIRPLARKKLKPTRPEQGASEKKFRAAENFFRAIKDFFRAYGFFPNLPPLRLPHPATRQTLLYI